MRRSVLPHVQVVERRECSRRTRQNSLILVSLKGVYPNMHRQTIGIIEAWKRKPSTASDDGVLEWRTRGDDSIVPVDANTRQSDTDGAFLYRCYICSFRLAYGADRGHV